jgi:hypothetical protein
LGLKRLPFHSSTHATSENEYVYEHLGELLDPPRHNVAARQTVDGATRGNNQFDRVNLSL